VPDVTPLPERHEAGDLVLRRWTSADAATLHRLVTENVEHLRPWMPWIEVEPLTVDDRRELLATWEWEWSAGGDLVLAVELDGVVVGSAGLHRRLGPDGLEIGYWIDHRRTGRGLATRVAGLLTSSALDLPGVVRTQIACDAANEASARVAEKLGYVLSATERRPRSAPGESGIHRLYRVERRDWRRTPPPVHA
jgi:ribosomal-protein-serine acetyltransferase